MWPVQLPPAVAGRLGAGDVRAHVRAALLLGHRHAAQRAALVVGQREPRLPLGRERRVHAQRRHGAVGHRDRAHHAGVGLRPQQLERRAGDVRARLRVAPRERVDLALDRAAQQPVPARVQLDLVDPVPVAVVGEQPRLVALGAAAVRLRLGRAGHDAAVAHAVDRPARPLALERILQRHVGRQQVDVLERDGLVEDVGIRLVQQHGRLPRRTGRRRSGRRRARPRRRRGGRAGRPAPRRARRRSPRRRSSGCGVAASSRRSARANRSA